MILFPTLKNDEIALLFYERNTRHILDVDLKLKTNDEQEVFLIFTSIQHAKEIANTRLKHNKNLECVIYNSKELVIKILH